MSTTTQILTKCDLESWKRKRKRTFVVYILQYFASGMELTVNVGTLWIYVTTLMNIDRPGLYYGLINAAVFLPPILFSAAIARWADHTRRIKFCLIIVNFLSMVGSMLYIIPWSPIYALCGSFLQGFSLTARPLIVGEIARSFDEVQRKLPILQGAYVVGLSTAPAFAVIFIKTNFWIGNIHITYGNVSGLIVFTFVALLQILVVTLVNDLSREFDLKEMNKCNDNNNPTCTWLEALKRIVSQTDTIFIMALSIFLGYLDAVFFRFLPLIIIQSLHYSYYVVNMSFTGYAVIIIIELFVLIKYKITTRGVYYCGIASLLSLLIIAGELFIFAMHIQDFVTNITTLVLFVFCLSLYSLSDKIFTQIICANLTHSSNQCYVEGIRVFVKRIGSILGSISTYYAFYQLSYFSFIVIITSFLSLIILLLRKKTLENPSPII